MRTLHEVLKARRQDILDAWTGRTRSSGGTVPVSYVELVDHLPKFLDELADTLLSSEADEVESTERSSTAAKHGIQRFRIGFHLEAVVQEYGTLHRCVLEVAAKCGVIASLQEHIVLDSCIYAGIADAVTQYSAQRDAELQRQAGEHFAFVAHEVRNPLASASLALSLLRRKGLLREDPLVALLTRAIGRARELVENTLTLTIGGRTSHIEPQPFEVGKLIDEAVGDSALAARDKNIEIRAVQRDPVTFVGDRRLVYSAVTNLIANGVKFTPEGGTIRIDWRANQHKVEIDVEDRCGGLPEGAEEKMFNAFVQVGQDRSGFGLGLAIARQAVQAHGGNIRVQNKPGIGCTLSIDLPYPSQNPPA